MTLPIYEALISSFEDGIVDISLVDMPAVESNWVAFNKQEQPLNFKVEDEEQHLITGVIMRCSFPIYRRDEMRGEFYIVYSKETIELMAQKLMQDGNHNRITLMHIEGSEVEGVELREIFIKNTEKGINPAGFEDIEDFSLFATYKVENPEIWSSIKNGDFKGFSLSGYFDIKQIKKEENMSVKTDLMNALLKFGEVQTEKGILYWEGEGDLKAEDEVFVGEDKTPAPDGDYKTVDGKVIKVVEGKVAEIVDPEAEVADGEKTEEMTEEKEEMEEETTETTTTTEETTTEETTEEPKDDEVAKLKEEVEVLKAEVETLKKAIEEINAQLSLPAELPIAEAFEKVTKPNKNEVKKNRALSILSHLND